MIATKSFKDYLFVGIQLLLFAAYFLPIKIIPINVSEWGRYSGLIILGLGLIWGGVALLQINTRLSPFPTPVANGRLITTGAYSIARHPIYTAVIFLGLGYAIYEASLYKILITLLLLTLFYYKSKYEETLLAHKFSEYQAYKKKTRRFI